MEHLRFIATCRTTGQHVGTDDVRVEHRDERIIVSSTHRHDASGLPVHNATHVMDQEWKPLSLDLVCDGPWSYRVRFGRDKTTAIAREKLPNGGLRTTVEQLSIPRERALFLLNVGFYFPMCAARRHLGKGTTVFDLIPTGYCIVQHVGDEQRPTGLHEHLTMTVSAGEFEDSLYMVVDSNRRLVEYETTSTGMRVRTQNAGEFVC